MRLPGGFRSRAGGPAGRRPRSTLASALGTPTVPETYAAMSMLTLVDGAATRAVVSRYGAESTLD
jgi:hypothetical protein